MRNLKKVLSLVLCVAMMLSVMVMSTGAASFTDQDEFSENYAEAAEVLTGMGVINGYEDGSFQPKDNITRAEVAAMIYRVATGDVDSGHPGMTAGANYFTDVSEDDWYAGYVNYCADAGYIKGFEDNTFRADENVTGYQVLAMILRAVGYDKNNEFTGTNWTINVASTAMQQGLLKNVDSSVNLSAEAPRELVAEFIFQAIRPEVKTVHAAPILGQYVKDAESLGEKVFDLAVDTDTTDAWGRPATVWYAESNTAWNGIVKNNGYQSSMDDLFANIEETPLATYTTAVKVCDVADDLGIADKQDFTTYTNGKAAANTDEVTINANATTATIGAQGRLTEVYEDTIVYIDTFLARVDKVTEVKYDADGHVAKDASLTLTIYDGYNNPVTLTDDTNYTYAEGDMLLVNAYTADDGDHAAIAVDTNNIAKYVEFVGAAESFVGAQTYIQWNDNQHTVDGDVYNDALHFHLDAAGQDRTENFNWWLDQYGNLIGVTAIDRTNYAVLKDMTWITGTPGYAQATLVYMDGSETTVTVNTIDGNGVDAANGNFWTVANDDAEPVMAASGVGFTTVGNTARVSSDTAFNALYDGFALYEVYTNDDGTVDLNGFEDNLANGLIIGYANRATIDVSGSEILGANGQPVALVDASTQILVNNDGTYVPYTGTNGLADFANASVEVFWSTDGTFTQNVYIKSYVEQAAFGEHLFTVNGTVGHEVGNTGYYEMVVYVDGVERTIVTNETTMDTLTANTGKLFHVTWTENPLSSALVPNGTYGYVSNVALVNEANDGDWAGTCNYLSEVTADDVGNGAIRNEDGRAYNLTNATQVIYNGNVTYTIENLDDAIEEGMGIWVVDDDDDINHNATAIYIGTKLDDRTALNVTSVAGGTVGDAEFAANNETATIEVDYAKGITQDTLTYTASDANSVLIVNGGTPVSNPTGTAAASSTDAVYSNNSSREVVVWNEAGTDSVTYTIVLNWYDLGTDATLDTVYLGNNNTTLPNWHSTAAKAVADPQGMKVVADSVEMKVTATDSNATVAIGRGTTVDLAVADLTETDTIELSNTTDLSGGYVLIRITSEDGNNVSYYAYQIQ